MRQVLGFYMRIHIHIDVCVPFLVAVVLPAGATGCVGGVGEGQAGVAALGCVVLPGLAFAMHN